MGGISKGAALQPPGTTAQVELRASGPGSGRDAHVRVSMLRCLLVLSLLAPLTFAAGWSYTPAGWSYERPLGVPLTVIASTAVLLLLVVLTARYGARRADFNDQP